MRGYKLTGTAVSSASCGGNESMVQISLCLVGLHLVCTWILVSILSGFCFGIERGRIAKHQLSSACLFKDKFCEGKVNAAVRV